MGNCCQGGEGKDPKRAKKPVPRHIKKGDLSNNGSLTKRNGQTKRDKYAKYNGDEFYEPDFDHLIEYSDRKLEVTPHHLVAKSNLYKNCNASTLAQKQFMLQQSNFVSSNSNVKNGPRLNGLSTSGVLSAIQNMKGLLEFYILKF